MAEGKILTYKGTGKVEDIPEIPYADLILQSAEKFGDEIAAVSLDTKAELTFNQVVQKSRALAAGLQQKLALTKGKIVAIALPNCLEFPLALLGVTLCGSTASFVNPIYKPMELDHVIRIIQPDLWICTPEFLPSLRGSLNYDSNVGIIVVGSAPNCISFEDIVNQGDWNTFIAPEIDVKEDVATMPFSSGTTGLPKAVMLTHYNLVTAHCQMKVWASYKSGSVVLGLLPMFHQYGCSLVTSSLQRGSKCILMRRFGLTDMLQALSEYKVTHLPLVPPIALLLCKNPIVDNYKFTIRNIITSAAALGKELELELIRKFGCVVEQGYGLTECTLATHFNNGAVDKPGTIGTVMPCWEVKIVNLETGEILGPNETGEICVRGPMVLKGYRGDPGSSAALVDTDGWLHTGDVGYYDEDEWFFIKDRIKELIKYKGNQVSPSELENLLLSHPKIADVAVAGLPDEEAGELPRAFVVKRPGSDLTANEVENYVADNMAPYKKLRGGVVFLDAIPKSASGKILRRELRQLLQ